MLKIQEEAFNNQFDNILGAYGADIGLLEIDDLTKESIQKDWNEFIDKQLGQYSPVSLEEVNREVKRNSAASLQDFKERFAEKPDFRFSDLDEEYEESLAEQKLDEELAEDSITYKMSEENLGM